MSTDKTTAEQLRELKATRKSLSDHLDRGLRCAGQSIKYLDIAAAALSRLQEVEAENERLQQDAHRYRWIRDGGWLLIEEDRGEGAMWPPADIVDARVDAEIAKAL